MRTTSRTALTPAALVRVALVCAALMIVTGCAPSSPAAPPVTPPSTVTTPTKPVPTQTVVPNVVGKLSNKAVEAIADAGLTAVEKSTHGPQDADAGEPGVVYRQTPAAGTIVALGTKVEIRYWWESQ